ncbi:response regulator [Salininema proteolyticum]|uniref:Response regulator n=1 Tax=Salininema proteolyticum TaxID=1607685 RepID=A0ABV8TZ75_9ACTN
MIDLLLVDDHPVVQAGLAALLDGEEGFSVVGRAADADGALEAARRLRPDLVLMDIQLAGATDGIEATRLLRRLDPAPQVLVLTTFDSDDDVRRAVDAGAVGYLLKACPPEELFAAVRSAAAGENVLSPRLASRMMRNMTAKRDALTAREVEIVKLMADGLSNADIASRLFISEATVKSHLVHIFRKLEVKRRTAAVAEARRQGAIRGV